MRQPKPYMDPYLAGIGIGIVLLAAYAFTGRGLGASGAFASVVATGTAMMEGTTKAASSPSTAPYLTSGITSMFGDWIVLELAGVVIGGFLSARLAGRAVQSMTARSRIVAAIGGGILMGIGAKFARGCTSGQALTGGALLSAGSWIFIGTCFAAGYLLAPVTRRLWQ